MSYDFIRINLVLREFVHNILKQQYDERLILMAKVQAKNHKLKFIANHSKTSAQIMVEEVQVYDCWEFLVVQAACLSIRNPPPEMMAYLQVMEYKNYYWFLEKCQIAKNEEFAKRIKEIEGSYVTIENYEDFTTLQGKGA